VIRECAPQPRDCTHRRYRYKNRIDEVERAKNRTKSTVRSKVEHVFAVMKLKFGFVKLRYRGLKKNATQLFAVCALVNLYLLRKKLLFLTPAFKPGSEGCRSRASRRRAKNKDPNAWTGMAEHLLPRRHRLIQSFPRSKHLGADLQSH